jgi:hypothetical protein
MLPNRKVYIMRKMGKSIILEDTYIVRKVRRVLPPEGKRGHRIIQFWDENHAQRSVTDSDIVRIK